MPKIIMYSFGNKYNKENKYNVTIDTRILQNPYYVPELKNLTGLDNRVYNFVIDNDFTKLYLEKIINFLDFYLENIFKKRDFVEIGIMCTGGKHRSVSITRYLCEHYNLKYEVEVIHRDVYNEIS